MLKNSVGISPTLPIKELAAPKSPTLVVSAIDNRPKGSIFAKSLDKSSLMNEVIRTAATSEADIIRAVAVDMSVDNTNVRIASTANHMKVTIGRRIRYSIM